jgi:DNA-binding transcriptional LysR family regulator
MSPIGKGPMTNSFGFDFRSLEAFVLTCKRGSMAAAAQRLGMTQPAVSQIIKGLETSLGVALVDRSHRPLLLTASGIFLREAAEHLLAEAQRIPSRLREIEGGFPPSLRVGLVESLASPFVPNLISSLQPALQTLSVAAGLAHTLREAFLDFQFDIIITNDPSDDLNGVVRHTILTEPYILIVPESVAETDEELDLGTLSRTLDLVRWSARSRNGAEIEQHLRRLRIEIPRRFEFDSSDTLVGIVAAGLSWAVLTPLCLVNSISRLGSARALPFPGPKFYRKLTIISRAGELDKVAERLAHTSRKILREKYLPAMLRVGPWLGDQITLDQ